MGMKTRSDAMTDRLQEIRDRVAKATPGEWEWRFENPTTQRSAYHHPSLLGPHNEPICTANDGLGIDSEYAVCNSEHDADLIAHARQDIPYLLRRLEAAEELVNWVGPPSVGENAEQHWLENQAARNAWEKAKEDAP